MDSQQVGNGCGLYLQPAKKNGPSVYFSALTPRNQPTRRSQDTAASVYNLKRK